MRAASRLLLSVVLTLPVPGCASDEAHHWAEARYAGLNYDSLYGVVATTIDGEGFPVRKRNTAAGELETDWVYGTSMREVRGPSRRKVFARVVPDKDSGGFIVKLRVAEEVLRQRGELATNVRASKDWESYSDNWEDATFLMAKLSALLKDYRVKVESMDVPARAWERDIQP